MKTIKTLKYPYMETIQIKILMGVTNTFCAVDARLRKVVTMSVLLLALWEAVFSFRPAEYFSRKIMRSSGEVIFSNEKWSYPTESSESFSARRLAASTREEIMQSALSRLLLHDWMTSCTKFRRTFESRIVLEIGQRGPSSDRRRFHWNQVMCIGPYIYVLCFGISFYRTFV